MKFSLIKNDKNPNDVKIILTYDVVQDKDVSIAIMHDLLKSVDKSLILISTSNDGKVSKNTRNVYDKATHHFYSELIVSKSNFFDAVKKLIEELYNNNKTFIAGPKLAVKLAVNLLTVSIIAVL